MSERFAPGLVTNLMTVEGSQQVMLRVRFVEMKRTILKELGFNFSIFEGDFAFTTGNFSLANSLQSFGTASVLGATVGAFTISALLNALEEKGLTKILAERIALIILAPVRPARLIAHSRGHSMLCDSSPRAMDDLMCCIAGSPLVEDPGHHARSVPCSRQ